MKKLIPVAAIAMLCVAWGASQTRWLAKNGKPLIEFGIPGEPRIHLGLRADGAVVWREITITTNSPSEVLDSGFYFGPSGTNFTLLTNYGNLLLESK